ncbi:hypothetical protein TRFO_01490 [Tritrichomonas foetus]|uniref:Uncharacterized protein n=1 Tax=Tritrichomonas foetus TaxID=1144522 RepID=A0A1J4K233_9EUKA|nr:hypothetical protein TRFO_01490 [Tritrichomonas foetus]|eukprot:OHT03804.1 hypothetical protein TRFO_01490 [Tritrichomonas foetus]
MKAALENMKSQNETKTQQIAEVSGKYQESLHTIEQLNITIQDLKEEIGQVRSENKAVNEQLTTTQAELENKPGVSEDQVIPISAWQSNEFEAELNTQINSLGLNNSLQPASKIKNIYKAIAKYFKKQLASREKATEQINTEYQKYMNTVNKFLVQLSITTEVEPVNSNEFFGKHVDQRVISAISDVRSCHDDLKRKNEQLNQGIARIMDTCGNLNMSLGGSLDFSLTMSDDIFSEIENQIADLKSQVSDLTSQIGKKNKKIKELTSSLKSTKRKGDSTSEDQKMQIKRLNEEKEDFQNQNEELQKNIQKLRWELQKVKNEYLDYQTAQEEAMEELKEKFEQQIMTISLDKAKIEAQLKEQIRIVAEQVNDTTDAIADNQDQITRLKQIVEEQKVLIVDKEHEIERLKEKNEEAIHDLEAKFQREKKQIIESYENAVNELREQLESSKRDFQKITKENEATQKQLSQAKENILQLKKEKITTEHDFKSKIEQYERQKKLTESASKAKIIDAQKTYTSQLDTEKKEFEEEKNRIYTTIAETFKPFFDPGDKLNEKSLKAAMFRARDEIQRLTETDTAVRRIVNANTDQKTDDAVAQVVIRNS